jgi:NAD(P)H-dependent FMN reductase
VPSRAQAELRKVLSTMGARVAEVELAVGHAHEKLDQGGELIDGAVRQELRDAVSALVELTLETTSAAV